jgi:hypothetical protein
MNILYLRNAKNEDIAEISMSIKFGSKCGYVDISCVIDITNYSTLLLNMTENLQIPFIYDIHELSEIRGWLWETYFANKDNTAKEYNNVLIEVKKWLEKLAKKYKLNVIED